jgi:hypothetical protein
MFEEPVYDLGRVLQVSTTEAGINSNPERLVSDDVGVGEWAMNTHFLLKICGLSQNVPAKE